MSNLSRKITTTLRLLPLILLGLLSASAAYAQNDPLFTQHWALPTLYNPAATGDTDWLRIRGAGRLQWIGITNAPKSFVATADMPFKVFNKRVGAGVTMLQESIGLFSNLLISAQGSYKLKFLKGQLGIGLQLGYYNSRFRATDAYIPDDDDYHEPEDPSIPKQDLTGNALDASLGLSYTHPLFHIGLSGMHLTAPTVKMEIEGSESTETLQYETNLNRTLYFDAGGNIALRNTLFLLQPSLLMMTDFSKLSAALTLRATYNRFLFVGIATAGMMPYL